MKDYLDDNNTSSHGNANPSTSTPLNAVNPHQTAPLKRTRAKRSCDFCRKRKSRCDADTSIPCSNCKAWGFRCEFQTVRKKRGPPSVYVDNLEKRCKKMEKLLTALTQSSISELERNDFRLPKKMAGVKVGHATNAKDLQEEEQNDKEYQGEDDEGNEEEEGDDGDKHLDLERHLAQLDISDYDEITYTNRSASVNTLDPKIFRSKPYFPWPGRNDVALQLTLQNELVVVRSGKQADKRVNVGLSLRCPAIVGPEGTRAACPSELPNTLQRLPLDKKQTESLTGKMIELYFSHIHQFLPIVNKAHFSATGSPIILVHAMLAVSLRFCSQYFPKLVQDADHHARHYFDKTLKRLRHSFRSRLSHVQAAILLTMYLDLDDGDDADSLQWYTLGTAIRMAQDLGLHRSCTHWNLPTSEKETRHRVFYACYVLDRWLSARAGKPLTILDRDFDADLPSPYEWIDDSCQPSSRLPIHRSFILLIKLSEILGRVLKSLYAPKSKHANTNAGLEEPSILEVFDRRLKTWKASLDEPLDGIHVPAAQKAYLHVYYSTVVILLHHPFADLVQTSKDVKQTSESASTTTTVAANAKKICTDAASVISHIIHRQRRQRMTDDPDLYFSLCLPTCFTYAMFQSCLIHLSNAVSDPTEDNRRTLGNAISLVKEYSHLNSAQHALDILNMLQVIHGSDPPVSSTVDNAAAVTKFGPDPLSHSMLPKPTQWFDSPIPAPFPIFTHQPLVTDIPASMCYDSSLWRDPPQLLMENHQYQPQLNSSSHHHSATVLGQFTDSPLSVSSIIRYPRPHHPSQCDIGYSVSGTRPSTSSGSIYHHQHTSSLSSTSSCSSSSFVTTPHSAALAQSNLSMSEWDMYIDQQHPQHQYDLMPPHS